ncbi:D-erythronate dehydrogenase [Pantoea sp. 1.19]|uniref:D-erythronate dehydrogenase n=1 Tax=Pantoea sp. 1.19 TaxID=1925589 RepID=UPI000948C310|nr:D-erythronate dehydrogenase [Pantoea sp. 1.19]
MNVVVTGAAGFLGKKLVSALLKKGALRDAQGTLQPVTRVVACDIVPLSGIDDPRLVVTCGDLSDAAQLPGLLGDRPIDSLFHLAAVVSGQAEQQFELGMKINVDLPRQLMEHLRHQPRRARLITTSSVAVFGGALPEKVPDSQVWMPQSSYGTQKAITDLLLGDYSRKGFLDGRSLRMPTIVVRPGKPNAAASSFASGILREPLNGEEAVCPVDVTTRLWLLSPNMAVAALIHAHEISEDSLTQGRVINMAGLCVTVETMLAALRRIAGDPVADRVRHQPDPAVRRIVNSWPGDFHAAYAHALGFQANRSIDEMIHEFIQETA